MLIKTNINTKGTSLSNNQNTINKQFSINNINRDFYSLNQNFDLTYLNYDKIDFKKDQKMTKFIIDNQFYNNKKRSSNEMKTQLDPNNNPDNFDQLLNITAFNQREIEYLDSIDSLSFFKFYTRSNLAKIESSNSLKDLAYSDTNLLFKYCIFANNYIFPKLSDEMYNKILYLGECLKTSYSIIKTSDFDIISKVIRLLTM